jgi:Tfp pilus assembly protein PilF
VNIESWDRAEEQFERLVAVAPDLYLGHIGMAFAACLKSDLAKFQSNAEKALQLNPDPYRAMQVAFCYDRLGQPGEAKTLVAKLLESPAAPDDPSWLFWASVVKSDLATAFDYLDKSVDTNFPPFTARNLAFYSAHPIYDKVRDHPRFQAAVARAKLPWREPS